MLEALPAPAAASARHGAGHRSDRLGKTTTLYAGLSELNSPEKKIITVEDPVEYRLPRINQVQVNAKIELTFARVLRAALRQDPTSCWSARFVTVKPPRSACAPH